MDDAASDRPLTEKRKAPAFAGCLLAGFFGIFVVVGSAIVWWLTIQPLRRVLEARSWEPTPCTVVASAVDTQSDSDGATYRVDIAYRYRYGGRQYESNRYDFSVGSSSGREGKQAAVDRYQPGEACTCYVDPGDPSRSVLERGWHSGYWIGLVGLPFLLAGAGGGIWTSGAFSGRRRAAPAPGARFSDWRESRVAAPLLLRPASGPWKKLAGALFAALFWNGIVWTIGFFFLRDWNTGNREWMPVLILTPFALIGLALLLMLPYSFLALFNPRPWIELQRGALVPGEPVPAILRLSGNPGRISKLTVTLEGREAVTVTTRSGNKTSTTTREGLFCRAVVFEAGAGGLQRETALTIAVPARTMHSLDAPNNAVRWKIKVAGEIPRWPDIDQDFQVQVLPRWTAA